MQVRAARAAQAAAQAIRASPGTEVDEASEGAPPADLPAFGKGIAFVPRSRRSTASGDASGEAAASGRAGEGSREGGAGGGGGGGAVGLAGVDRLGGGQGAMALDAGLAAEDGAEEVHQTTACDCAALLASCCKCNRISANIVELLGS